MLSAIVTGLIILLCMSLMYISDHTHYSVKDLVANLGRVFGPLVR
jgi:hypothetical protein